MRKSFQTYIKESRRRSSVDEGTIEKLKQENKSLKQHLIGSTVPEKVNVIVRPDLLRQSTAQTFDETEVESSYRRSYGSDQSSWLVREVKEETDDVVEDLGKELATKMLFSVRGGKSARIAGVDGKDASELFAC